MFHVTKGYIMIRFRSCRSFQMDCRCAHFADELWRHVRRVAELSAHLQVADTADGIPELCQAVGARHQQSYVGSGVAKLGGRREWKGNVSTMENIMSDLKGSCSHKRHKLTLS